MIVLFCFLSSSECDVGSCFGAFSGQSNFTVGESKYSLETQPEYQRHKRIYNPGGDDNCVIFHLQPEAWDDVWVQCDHSVLWTEEFCLRRSHSNT